LRAEYAKYQGDDRANLAELQSAVLKAFGEVEQAMVAEKFLGAREQAIIEALQFAKEASDAAASEYAGGVGEVLTLITAQRSRINLASQKTTLRRLRLDNRITLHLALGGDYRSQN
jgi:outer membrane protein TolC